MKKRCLGFFPSSSFCRYFRWFFYFYKNPFISSRPLTRKELFDVLVVFTLSLLLCSCLFVLLLKVFISVNISAAEVVHPFYGVLLMFQSALVYGVIFGFCLHALSRAVGMRFFIRIILQALRLYAMMMPLLVMLFFVVAAMMLNGFLKTQNPPWLFWLTAISLSWMLWLQYAVMVRPVARYLSEIFSRRKSMALATGALLLAIATLQLASVSYTEHVFEQKRFFAAAVEALYADGTIGESVKNELTLRIKEMTLFGTAEPDGLN